MDVGQNEIVESVGQQKLLHSFLLKLFRFTLSIDFAKVDSLVVSRVGRDATLLRHQEDLMP